MNEPSPSPEVATSGSPSRISSIPIPESDTDAVRFLREAYEKLIDQIRLVIVGQTRVIDELLIALFARGHCLLEGVPGLAKTLMIRTLASCLSLQFSRIQFTPDLMPADITGTELIQEDKLSGSRELRFFKGPIFANVILADEINRTPPKTQAALLEAMQEHQVTVAGKRYPLEEPFFVLATQNPIEQEGTYPLPEAQLDRFMFKCFIDYPSEEEEWEIVCRTTSDQEPSVEAVLTGQQIVQLQRIVRRVPVPEYVGRFALRLVRLSRPQHPEAPEWVRRYVAWGAGPRGSQYLILGAKARAVLQGRYHVTPEDIQAVAYPVLRHRILTNFNAEAEGIRSDEIIRRLLEFVIASEEDSWLRGQLAKVFRPATSG